MADAESFHPGQNSVGQIVRIFHAQVASAEKNGARQTGQQAACHVMAGTQRLSGMRVP